MSLKFCKCNFQKEMSKREPSFAFTGMLTGMNETSAVIIAAPQNFTPSVIFQKVVNIANVGAVPSGQDNIHRWVH